MSVILRGDDVQGSHTRWDGVLLFSEDVLADTLLESSDKMWIRESQQLNTAQASYHQDKYKDMPPSYKVFLLKVLTRFDSLQSTSGRPWTSHANPMSMVLLDEDVKDVCELGFATNNSPSDVRSRAPCTTATCVWQVRLRRLMTSRLPRLTPRLLRLPRPSQRPLLRYR